MDLQNIGKKRLTFIWGSSIVLIVVLLFRLFSLQVLHHDFYTQKLNSQIEKTVPLPASRGNIYDCNKVLLATTMDSYSIYVMNNEVSDQYQLARELSAIFGSPVANIYDLIKTESNFAWILRKVTDEHLIARVKKAKLKGVYLLLEQKRFYLNSKLGAHVIGYVNIDNKGQGGVELIYDDFLRGIDGKMIHSTDPQGKSIYANERIIQRSIDGYNLQLTIDEVIQYQTAKSLREAHKKFSADSSTAIVLDVKTGEIISMVSLPDFDCNLFFRYRPLDLRNNNVQTIYEPGSTFKLITVAAALASGVAKPSSTFSNGIKFDYGTKTIREAHIIRDPFGVRTVRDIIVESLNIGAAKLGIKIGRDIMQQYISKFGFGVKTGIDLPGESSGIVRNDWRDIELATISFGQGIAVTPLQLVAAVAAIANDGEAVQPHVVKNIINSEGEVMKEIVPKKKKVLGKDVSWELRKMMAEVVEGGTARNAAIKGYSIGGKTGTAQKVKANGIGYEDGVYVSSFVGIFPIENPQYAILVVIDNPKGRYYYGSSVAAPVFRKVADEIIRYKGLPPFI